MRLALVCVGKLKAGPERLLFDRYFKRLTESARGAGFAGVDLREISGIAGAAAGRTPSRRSRGDPCRRAQGRRAGFARRARAVGDQRGMGRGHRPGAGRVATGLCRGDRRTGRARPVARPPWRIES